MLIVLDFNDDFRLEVFCPLRSEASPYRDAEREGKARSRIKAS